MKKTVFILFTLLALSLNSCSSDDDSNEGGGSSTTATLIVNATVEGLGAIAGIELALNEEVSDDYVQEKVSNAQGSVTFENILPGSYSVDGYYFVSSSEEYIGQSNSFQLSAGESRTITLTLD